MNKLKKVLIVGAGFSGAVIARVLADNGFQVDVIDRRNHLAGNAYDEINEHGIRVHRYGPHLFHTNNIQVVDWLSKYCDWVPYDHRVKAMLSDGTLVTLPVNSETAMIVGQNNIIDTFFKPYTKKMWGVDPEDLDPNVWSRVPIRDDMNELYFPNDQFQALPCKGYTSLINNILNHNNIAINLSTSFSKSMESNYSHVFNSMAIDEYFDYKYGRLPYRSIKFHHVTLPLPKLFPVAVVNFTHTGPFTRITEWKNLPNHGANNSFSSLTYEEPCDYVDNNYERYYPIKDLHGKNRELYKKYRKLVSNNMTFIGRCGQYVYIDMHQAVSSSLATAQNFINGTLNKSDFD